MRKVSVLLAGLLGSAGLLLPAAAAPSRPVTKAQLLSMAGEKVDAKVIRAIVERDCVDFDVDAGNAAELSRALPPEVLQAAIACRGRVAPDSPAAAPRPQDATPARNPEGSAAPSVPLPAPAAVPAPSASSAVRDGDGSLRLSAEFIGESGSLSCSCLLDGQPIAMLTKPAEGEFGQAVPRAKIRKETADLPVATGTHRLLFRCDPNAQEISEEIQIDPGRLRTVRIRETTLRHWKLFKIE